MDDIHHYPAWLTLSKVEAPFQNVNLIERTDVHQILERSASRKCIVVVAPAGFGKTTLLTQVAKNRQRSGSMVAWINLDDEENDPVMFLSFLIFSVVHAGIKARSLEAIAGEGFTESLLTSLMPRFLNMLTEHKGKITIVLDDYQYINSKAVDDLVSYALTNLPENVQLILSSRTLPSVDLPRHFVSGHAIEIRAQDLLFSYDEVKTALGHEYSDEKIDLVYKRTEGWPVAVHLAHLLLSEEGGLSILSAKFTGDKGHIATYLADQVIAYLPAKSKDFLIKTSILSTFSAPLANTVCNITDSLKLLSELETIQPLLTSVDDKQETYRYHTLFQEYLQNLLRKETEVDLEELYLRASHWYVENNLVSEAIRYAGLAKSYALCARLIEEAGGWELVLYGGTSYLRKLLRNIPHTKMPEFPRLQLAQSYLLAKEGEYDEARALLDTTWLNIKEVEDSEQYMRDYQAIALQVLQYADQYSNPQGLNEFREYKKQYF